MDIIKSKLRYKIMFFMFILMTVSSILIMLSTMKQVEQSNIKTTQKYLTMLNESMFQSLRNAMNTGDPQQIKKAEEDASEIEGVKNLTVAKSKALIELYSPNTQYTTDSAIIEVFQSKETKTIEYNDPSHDLRMIKPMIATKDCLICHVNQKENDVIGVMDLTFSLEESDQELHSIITNITIISTILGWITLIIIFLILKKSTKPLETLNEAIKALMKYSSANQEISVKTNDEIGEVANSFNTYIKKVRDGIYQDQKIVEEVERAVQMVRSGFFIYEIKAKSTNRSTNDLVTSVNTMIKDLGDKFDEISKALVEYGNANFDYKFDVSDTSGTIGSIIFGTKSIGSNVSEMLATIMISGENLSKNIEVLTSSATALTDSSSKQMESLQQTEEAVKYITENINRSSKDVTAMERIADEVTISAEDGSKLASQTADSMDSINNEISMISEAVEMIDKIAFQTNILSLNAAVEAATAGEAGKGFAVVAQEVRNLASRSAQAASEIKLLVENATKKASEGKKISDAMISGYASLNEKIMKTKEYIDHVSDSSKEQTNSVDSINNALVSLNGSSKQNSQNASKIDHLSKEVNKLSNRLISVASNAKFRDEARDQVCDIEMVYKLNSLKLDHIKFKNTNFKKLDQHTTFTVVQDTQCNLGKWIVESESQNESFTKTDNWQKLKHVHSNVHSKVQEYIDENARFGTNEKLLSIASEIEKNTSEVFKALNIVKREHCSKYKES